MSACVLVCLLCSAVTVVGLGNGCKRLTAYLQCDKVYTVTAQLGSATDTYDADGTVTHTATAEQLQHIDAQVITEILQQFTGTTKQQPPVYSALKQNGQKAYEVARKGLAHTLKLEPRLVHIHHLQLLHYDHTAHTCAVRVQCGKGTYVRSLIHDLGLRLLCYAHVVRLIREQQGEWKVQQQQQQQQAESSSSLLPVINDRYSALELSNVTLENVSTRLLRDPQLPDVASISPISQREQAGATRIWPQ